MSALKPRNSRDNSSEPIRSCVACRAREEKEQLLRLVLRGDVVEPDPKGRATGRGAWIHEKCFSLAVQRSSISRAFRVNAPLDYSALERYLTERGEGKEPSHHND